MPISETLLDVSKAASRANEDWILQKAVHLSTGTPKLDGPHYDPTCVLYQGFLGSVSTNEIEQYAFVYNRTVRSLLLTHGIPDWAPARRLPSAGACLEHFRHGGQPFASFSSSALAHEEPVCQLLGKWQPQRPLLWCCVPALHLLLFGGVLEGQHNRIDVVDILNNMRWMATYGYPNEEYGDMPWSG